MLNLSCRCFIVCYSEAIFISLAMSVAFIMANFTSIEVIHVSTPSVTQKYDIVNHLLAVLKFVNKKNSYKLFHFYLVLGQLLPIHLIHLLHPLHEEAHHGCDYPPTSYHHPLMAKFPHHHHDYPTHPNPRDLDEL